MGNGNGDEDYPNGHVEAAEEELMSAVRRLKARVGSLYEVLDQLEQDLRVMFELRRRGRSATAVASSDTRSESACSLVFQSSPDDSANVQIDGRKFFQLAPRLAQVFYFLATGPDDAGDSLVSWRSRDDIAKFLQDKTGKKFRKRYVNSLIHQLKKALKTAGESPALIQTNRYKGVRLALERQKKNVIGGVLL